MTTNVAGEGLVVLCVLASVSPHSSSLFLVLFLLPPSHRLVSCRASALDCFA